MKCQYAYRALFRDAVNTKYEEATYAFHNNEYCTVAAGYNAIVVLGIDEKAFKGPKKRLRMLGDTCLKPLVKNSLLIFEERLCRKFS
jgi:hypothetical protein